MKSRAEWEEELRADGYRTFFVHEDPSRTHYPEHTHPIRTAHVILSGGMALKMLDTLYILRDGERIDIPAATQHNVTIGSEGCTYLVGE